MNAHFAPDLPPSVEQVCFFFSSFFQRGGNITHSFFSSVGSDFLSASFLAFSLLLRLLSL